MEEFFTDRKSQNNSIGRSLLVAICEMATNRRLLDGHCKSSTRKKSKELDDSNQAKTDYRDARIIAQLLKDTRFSEPNLLEGVYEELRNAKKLGKAIVNDLKRIKNQIFPRIQKRKSEK